MTRRIALFAPLALTCVLLLGVSSASARPELISPASDSVQTGGIVHVAYSIPDQIPDGNSAHLTFTAPDNSSYKYGVYGPQGEHFFTFAASHPFDSTPRLNEGAHVPLPDGIYTVTFDWTTDLEMFSVVNTNVRIKSTTTPPDLITPENDAKVNAFAISYSLPDAPYPDSTELLIDEVGGPTVCTLNLTDVPPSTVRSFTLNLAPLSREVASTTGACTFTDRAYTFTLRYRDEAGDPYETDMSTPVTLDRVTEVPTLTTPAANGVYPDSIDLNYSLPELPFSASGELTFTGPSNSVVHLSNASAGAQGYSLNPKALFDGGHTMSVTGDAVLADGLYTVTLSYRDALNNPAASSVTATNVRIGPVPAAPGTGGGGSDGGGGGAAPNAKKCFIAARSVSRSGALKKTKKYSVKLSGKVSADGQSVVISSKVKGVKISFLVDGKKVAPVKGSITVTNNPSLVTVSFKVKGKTKKLKIQLAQAAC